MITKTYPPFAARTKPFDHQQSELTLSQDREYYALFWEMGTGKSKPLVDTMAWLFLKCEIDGVLIVSDKGAYLNWFHNEVPKHMMEGIPYRMAYHRSGARKAEQIAMQKVMVPQDDMLDVLCINIESFSSETGVAVAAQFLKSHHAMMIIDESTSIKNPKSARAKAAMKLGQLAEFRRIATGTPITQSPLDMFSQCQFLKPGVLGFTSFVAFRSFYAIIQTMRLGTRQFPQIVGYRNLDNLTRSIQPFSSRILKRDCLDLPEKLYEVIYVEQTPEQAQAYRDLKEVALVQFASGIVTSTSALTTIEKLHQINCGHIKDDDGVTHDIPSARASLLTDLISDQFGKAIIWCCYRRDFELIKRQFDEAKLKYVEYHGGIADKDRPLMLDKFHNDPEVHLIGNPQVGGKSLTLVESNKTYYYSNSYNLEHRLQSEDRNHRIGQKNNVTYIDFVCPKTVDEKILKALRSKKNIADQVLDHFRELLIGDTDDLNY